MVSEAKKPELPLLPVFLPLMLTFGCLCVPTSPLLFLSEGRFGFASMLMLLGGTLGCFMMTTALALTRAENRFAKYVRWFAYTFALVFAVWIVVRQQMITSSAMAGADAQSQATMRALGEKDQPWTYLAALLSIIPVVVGGAIGARWIESARARRHAEPTSRASAFE